MRGFPENVKRHQNVFLQQIHRKSGIKLLLCAMDTGIRKFLKFFCTFFDKYDCIYIFHITICKISLFSTLDTLILPKKQIGGIARTPFSRKKISDTLNLYIRQTSVHELYHNIHNNKTLLICNSRSVTWYNLTDLHFCLQDTGQQLLQSLRMIDRA